MADSAAVTAATNKRTTVTRWLAPLNARRATTVDRCIIETHTQPVRLPAVRRFALSGADAVTGIGLETRAARQSTYRDAQQQQPVYQ